ncbi:YbaB/EbfC family nucleoid-associated protein [Saccharopolyspora mangrovi]|uniref:YbaB/EbfC family nucleoid-associated protein n=1 Tax=Saccharopolyspora mangrovi TaxID=3082379 RepID=A0ABU6AB75_9PSEU|nr:YbaB/EbfC family nucleoid-associated protein [Saccharopolyspora sp. S2-29]MEB3368717.1 YbaB/EbfC family nucleoid-associated protein [Saccharopolyspora sp. S2-29]
MAEDFGRDIGAAERMVREWQDRAAEKAEKFNRLQQQVEQISVTETSRDGAIQVTISSSGMLQGLQLADNANNRPMPRLGAEIMRLVQQAQAKIPGQMQQAVEDTVGLADSAAQHVLDQARRHFPEPPPEEEPPRGAKPNEIRPAAADDHQPPRRLQSPGRRRPDDFDDDFGNGSFLR